MHLLTARRSADAFAHALQEGGTPARGTEQAMAMVARLSAAGDDPAAAPSAQFRDGLRRRLLAVAAVQAPGGSAPEPVRAGWQPARRRPLLVAGAMAGLVAVGGVTVAGAQSLPGTALYPVKMGAETLQLATAFGPFAEGKRHLQFASARLGDLTELLRQGAQSLGPVAVIPGRPVLLSAPAAVPATVSATRVEQVLEDMEYHARLGVELLRQAWEQDQRRESLELLRDWSTEHATALEELVPAIPDAGMQRMAEQAAKQVDQVADLAADALEQDCATGCPGDEPGPAPAPPDGSTEPSGPAVGPVVPGQPGPSDPDGADPGGSTGDDQPGTPGDGGSDGDGGGGGGAPGNPPPTDVTTSPPPPSAGRTAPLTPSAPVTTGPPSPPVTPTAPAPTTPSQPPPTGTPPPATPTAPPATSPPPPATSPPPTDPTAPTAPSSPANAATASTSPANAATAPASPATAASAPPGAVATTTPPSPAAGPTGAPAPPLDDRTGVPLPGSR